MDIHCDYCGRQHDRLCGVRESYLDYDYAAAGGRGCWQADDCCRAGSAFCHHFAGPVSSPSVVGEIHDPVPELAPSPAEPAPPPETDQALPLTEPRPPVLTPPTTTPEPVVPDAPDSTTPADLNPGLPPIGELDLPPLEESGLLPDQSN